MGGLVAFFTYTSKLYSPVKALSKMNLSMQKILAAGDRVFEVMDIPPEAAGGLEQPREPGLSGALAHGDSGPARLAQSGDIRFENVSFGYDPGHPVLKNFCLHVKPGELVALVGPSGGGKTTVVNLLLRFYEPTSGRILIDGVPLTRIPLQQLRRQIGIVSQDIFLFSGAARENIAYASPDASDMEIVQAARAAYAHDFLSASSDGYLTEVGERGFTAIRRSAAAHRHCACDSAQSTHHDFRRGDVTSGFRIGAGNPGGARKRRRRPHDIRRGTPLLDDTPRRQDRSD